MLGCWGDAGEFAVGGGGGVDGGAGSDPAPQSPRRFRPLLLSATHPSRIEETSKPAPENRRMGHAGGHRRNLFHRKSGSRITETPFPLLLSAIKQHLRWFVDRVFLRVLRLSFGIPLRAFAAWT